MGPRSKWTEEELVRRTLDGAYTLALRLTGNAADAWDLTQEALLRAIPALPDFRGDADPKTWVYRIVVNCWKNRQASRAFRWWRRLLPLDESAQEEEGGPRSVSSDADPPPEKELERRESLEAFERALARLAPEDRAALVLRELEEKSYAEIAEILGVPIGTVKSRLHRARSELARLLEGLDEP